MAASGWGNSWGRIASALIAVASAIVLCVGLAGAARADIINFTAFINGAQEVPVNASAGTGSGTFVMDTVANTLSVNVTFGGLGSAEIAAHIHGPAAPGVNAAILFGLPLGSPKVAVWNFPEAQEASIIAGLMYVNIHSVNFPGGEVRGQILQAGTNFQCWRVRNRPKFARVTATVVDTFAGTNSTQIRRPLLLCDQAGVNGDGTAGPGRQSCFKVRGAKLSSLVTHSVTDMFGTRNEIKRKKAMAVCVPATSTP